MTTFIHEIEQLVPAATTLLLHRKEVSVSLLQRHFKLAYSKGVALMARLQDAGVVGPANPQGVRLLDLRHYQPVLFNASARERHVRMLRDLALYMVEAREEGGAGNTNIMSWIRSPVAMTKEEIRDAVDRALTGGLARPVLAVARGLATLPGASSADTAA